MPNYEPKNTAAFRKETDIYLSPHCVGDLCVLVIVLMDDTKLITNHN